MSFAFNGSICAGTAFLLSPSSSALHIQPSPSYVDLPVEIASPTTTYIQNLYFGTTFPATLINRMDNNDNSPAFNVLNPFSDETATFENRGSASFSQFRARDVCASPGSPLHPSLSFLFFSFLFVSSLLFSSLLFSSLLFSSLSSLLFS